MDTNDSMIAQEMIARDLRNINHALAALSKQNINLGIISDTLNTFDDLYHNEAVIFYLLCKEKKCFSRVWKSFKTKDGRQLNNHFFVGVETSAGPIMLTLSADDIDMFRDAVTVDCAPYDEAMHPYTADKINAM